MSRSAQSELQTGLERIRVAEVSVGHHHYIVLSLLNAWMETVAAPVASGVVLDYGCGGQPYRRLLERYAARYIGADVAAAAGITPDVVLTPGEPVPLPDASVDTILSTQVLEHVYDFKAYLADCSRLLRPGGKLILSAPMHWRHHEVPYDYWRFTRFSLWQSLENANFCILDFRPCGGIFAMLGQAFMDHLSERGRHSRLVSGLINQVALWLDKRLADTNDTLGWMCIAEKSQADNYP